MKKILLILASILSLSAANAFADGDMAEFQIIVKDHKFTPQNTNIPANQKVKLVIDNQDRTAEEFESTDLSREKIVGGNKKMAIFIGPLKAGIYKYYGDFNPDTAQGTITAK